MIKDASYKLFGKLVEPYADYFDSLKFQLKRARMDYTVEEYVSVLLLASLAAFIAVILAGSFYLTLTTTAAFYSYTLSIIISVCSGAGAFFTGYFYPNLRAKGIQGRINKTLPFTTIYMSTAAASEVTVEELFRIVSLKKGEIGRECGRIYRDIHMLGMDAATALTKAANRTASPEFAELLWGMLSVLNRGGNMGEYFSRKSKEYMNEYRRSLKDYSKQISFYTEIYITLVIVGTLFFIVLSSIMSPLVGGDILLIQTFMVFFFIPLVSVGFLVLLKGLSPAE